MLLRASLLILIFGVLPNGIYNWLVGNCDWAHHPIIQLLVELIWVVGLGQVFTVLGGLLVLEKMLVLQTNRNLPNSSDYSDVPVRKNTCLSMSNNTLQAVAERLKLITRTLICASTATIVLSATALLSYLLNLAGYKSICFYITLRTGMEYQ